MNIISKNFDELTTKELYEILKARAQIFVVDQKCVYQDLDDIDYSALHVFIEEDGKVLAYLRAFIKDDRTIQLGRVLTIKHGVGLGATILNEGIKQVRDHFKCENIYIEAQSYAIGYYEKAGFEVCSEEFLEEGIPHVKMILRFKNRVE